MEDKIYPSEVRRVIIPDGFEDLGEFEVCPFCKEEGSVYGNIWPNENGGVSGDYKCMKCEQEWSKS